MPRRTPPNELATREAFFLREQQAWKTLQHTWAKLPEAALVRPGACGPEWSVKDVLNHLAAWQEAALGAVDDLLAKRWARLGANTDNYNQQHYAQDRDRPLASSRARLRFSRAKLLKRLKSVPEAQLLNENGRQAIGWWAKWADLRAL
ncbi:MAG: DinB family protein [Anaerolineales bacterium]